MLFFICNLKNIYSITCASLTNFFPLFAYLIQFKALHYSFITVLIKVKGHTPRLKSLMVKTKEYVILQGHIKQNAP